MKKLFFLILSAALFFSPLLWRGAGGEAFAQTAKKAGNWTLKLAEINKVFVENKGQFDGRGFNQEKNNQSGNAIEYGVRYNGVEMYFTKSGITFRHDQFIPVSEAEMEEQEKQPAKKENREEEEQEKQRRLQPQFLGMTWSGSNPDAQLTAEQGVSHYFTYFGNNNKTIKAKAFKKISYKNIYPNIDVEYVFPAPSPLGMAEEGLLKYNIILHPGANPDVIKMHYTGAEKMYSDNKGNITIVSAFGDFTDHAPVTYGKKGSTIQSAFELNSNTVSFKLDDQALSPLGRVGERLTIDPWVTIPAFSTTDNKAYDIDWDYQGNVYAYGGDANTLQLIKLDTAGAIQWVNQTVTVEYKNYYGDFAIDRITGNAYVCKGFVGWAGDTTAVVKLDTDGNGVAFASVGNFTNECWRIAYNSFTKQGVIGSGGTDNTYQVATFNADLTTITPANIFSTDECCHDIALLALDDTNCYMLSAGYKWGPTVVGDNTLIKCNLSNLSPPIYIIPSGYNFEEINSIKYYPSIYGSVSNGFNGMAKSKRYLYTYDGRTLKKWNPLNGSFIKSVAKGTAKFAHGGIAVDECDESIYLGVGSSVQKYDSALTLITSFTAPGVVYDVALAVGGNLIACGVNFVSSLAVSSALSSFTLSISADSATCAGNDGSAMVKVTGGSPPFYYLWTKGGQTTSGITGLSPGKYPVVVSKYDGSGCTLIGIKTDTAVVTSSSGFTGQSNSVTNPCFGQNNGTVTENAVGGVLPYIYLWMPGGQRSQTATDLAAGTYTVTVKDAAGCQTVDEVKLSGRTQVVATLSMTFLGSCTGGQLRAFPNGGIPPYTFLWSTGDTNQYFLAPDTGTYSVIVKDVNACMDTASITVAPDTALKLAVSPNRTICQGESVILTAVGAGNYPLVSYTWLPATGLNVSTWLPPAGFDLSWGSSVTASPDLTTTYSIIAISGLCISDTSIRVTVVSLDSIAFISGNVTITTGQSTVLSAVGGAYYTWLPAYGLSCTGCAIPIATPSQTTTYTLTATDLNGCTATDMVTVVVVCGNVFVPTAFSPNDDGTNDVLFLKSDCVRELDFKIYDRWGNNVFQSTNVTDGWDGTYRGKPMDPAVLVYYVNAVLLSGETITKKGNISLVR